MIMVSSAASTTMRRRQHVGVVVTVREGLRPRLRMEEPTPAWTGESASGYYINAARRRAAEPVVGPGSGRARPRPRQGGGTQAIRSGLPANRPPTDEKLGR